MAHGVGAVLAGTGDLGLGYQRPGDARAQQIIFLVNRPSPEHLEAVILREFLAKVNHLYRAGAGRQSLGFYAVEFLDTLAHIGDEGDDLAVIFFPKPGQNNRGVQPAGIRQHDFFDFITLSQQISPSYKACSTVALGCGFFLWFFWAICPSFHSRGRLCCTMVSFLSFPRRRESMFFVFCHATSYMTYGLPLHVEVFYAQGVFLYKLSAPLDVVAHQQAEHPLGFLCLVSLDPLEYSSLGVHRGAISATLSSSKGSFSVIRTYFAGANSPVTASSRLRK